MTLIETSFQHCASIFSSIGTYFSSKLTVGSLILIYSFLFSIDKVELMTALTVLITFDLISGIFAAKKSGELIESRKVLKSAIKLAVYGILVSASHLTDVVVSIPETWTFSMNIEGIMIAFLAATELISIIENFGKAGFAVPKKLLNRLQEYTETNKK